MTSLTDRVLLGQIKNIQMRFNLALEITPIKLEAYDSNQI